jgi:hypothetical protein
MGVYSSEKKKEKKEKRLKASKLEAVAFWRRFSDQEAFAELG